MARRTEANASQREKPRRTESQQNARSQEINHPLRPPADDQAQGPQKLVSNNAISLGFNNSQLSQNKSKILKRRRSNILLIKNVKRK